MGTDVFMKAGMLLGGSLMLAIYFKPVDISLPEIPNPKQWIQDIATGKKSPTMSSSEPKITVMVVDTRANVDAMRSAVEPGRIIADSPNAFALKEGRVFTTDVASANIPINDAGWAGRPLDIIQPPSRRADVTGELFDPEESEHGGDNSDLINKKELSYGETMRVLKNMN